MDSQRVKKVAKISNLTGLTDTSKHILLQLRPNGLKNHVGSEVYQKTKAYLDKSDGGGGLALSQWGWGDACHHHILSILGICIR